MSDGIHSYSEALTCQIFGYIGMGASFLYFCLILVLCKRINLAIAIVKETSKAVAAMPLIILMPIIQVFGIACFLVVWTIYAIYLAASGDIVETTASYSSGATYTYKSLEYSDNSKYAFLYMIFTWFWTSEFIVAIGQISIALAITSWYFTKDKSTIGNSTVFWAMRSTLFYHMGTAAFGSLVIAIIKTIRAVIAYLQKQAKQQQNKIMEYVMCVCQCCMWCLEKCMKFLNKNAYIITAIYGYSFLKSARVAFFTLLRNILRVSAVSLVSEFVLMLGKVFVPMSTVFILYLIMVCHLHYYYHHHHHHHHH
jgi:choline transporter-like protein 2/4/5